MPETSHVIQTVHVDINTGNALSLNDFSDLACTEAICQNIIATTLEIVMLDTKNSFNSLDHPITMSLYLVATDEGQQLNNDYRHKSYATNVLSFPSDVPEEILSQLEEFPLGELVICLPVVLKEAKAQRKQLQHHFTHLLVHGCLHLVGYDHELSDVITEADAEHMERLEVAVLNKLGITNPYQDT